MKAHNKKLKSYFNLDKINIVIRLLTISDVVIISSVGLVSPIFAVFVIDSIDGGGVEVAGIAAAIYLLSKSLFRIPFATIIDKIKGERDDFWFMFVGSILFSAVPLLYLLISTPLQLYLVQFLYGIFTAMASPPWYAIFTRHIDKNYEGIEWGIYGSFVDLGAAATAAIGGLLAHRFGFDNLFISVSIISLVGTMFLLGIRKSLLLKNNTR